MKICAIKQISDKISALPKNLKRSAKIATVALPMMVTAQSCSPWFYFPFFCPPPAPCPCPIVTPPPPPPPPHCRNHCDTKALEEAEKELSVLA